VSELMWIVGAGGIGSAAAGRLVPVEPVLLVDTWREHVDAINRDGLRVDYPAGPVHVRPRAVLLADLIAMRAPAPDVVLLAVKSDQTHATVSALLPLLRPDTLIVSVQNGLNEPTVAELVGAARTVGSVVRIDGALVGPGHATRAKPDGDLIIGSWPSGTSDAVQALAVRLRAGLPIVVTENITGELWSKLIRNACLNAVSTLTGMGLGEMAASEDVRTVSVEVALEGVRVAHALGLELDPGVLWGADAAQAAEGDANAIAAVHRGFRAAYEPYPRLKPSMLQDFEKGRSLETDQLNGEIVAAGQRVAIATRLNERIIHQVSRLLQDRSLQGRSLLLEA
jgi:2-dehydropantoate 2-reductase